MSDHKAHEAEQKKEAEQKAQAEKDAAEKLASDEAAAKKDAAPTATPQTEKQRKASIRMELAKLDQESANIAVRKTELRAQLATTPTAK